MLGSWKKAATARTCDQRSAIKPSRPPGRSVVRSRFTLPITWGAPWGDNMMTGCTGLVEAVRRAPGMNAIEYI